MAVRIEARAEPIPGYKLIDRLGGGGFGEVWKAEAPGGLLKAIKFVFGDLRTVSDNSKGENPSVRAEQELKAMSRVITVRHPYILSLERFDIIDGQLIIVMELADKNLWDRFREHRSQGLPGIPREELLGYMDETAEALDLMNGEHQLQHLDIKPQNIFLVHNHVKVADFGLVKDLEGMVASVTGGVTPVYAAPETFDGWVSRYCDQYSLAIVYQELLTGQRPFTGTNVRQLVMQHLQGVPNLAPLPPAERTIVARALAKNPDDRFPTCTEFVKELRQINVEPPTATLQELVLEDFPHSVGRIGNPATSKRPDDETGSTTTSMQSRATASPARPARLSTPKPPRTPGPPVAMPLISAGCETAPGRPTALDICGDGVLLPSLILGLGGFGLQILQQVRGLLVRQFGTLDAIPHVRLLHIDTDPEARQTDRPPAAEENLAPNEVFLARLNRPSHYLKSQDSRARLDTWMDTQLLYRMPRTPATTGIRALGRLAFFDHYKGLLARLQDALQACRAPDVLKAASKQTGLTLRSNRPRVYLLANLGGGTGSGMFLDLAYLLRGRLLKMGYLAPDVVGTLFLPPASRQHRGGLALANTYAALTELNHFSAPGTSFSARYGERDPPVLDAGSPFSRCVLLPLPEVHETQQTRELIGLTADFLTRDLFTPLGRLADLCRARLPGSSADAGLSCQSFGLYRLAWPRTDLIRRVARRICCQLVERWATKDSAPLRRVAEERVAGEWANKGLNPESVIEQLQRACEKALGEAPESQFAALTALLAIPAGKAPEIDPEPFADALARLEKIVGRIDADTLTRPPVLLETLSEASAELVAKWCAQLDDVVIELIEQPEYRLAGAEEVLRQFVATIQKTLEHYEPLGDELSDRVTEARARLDALLTSLRSGRRNAQVAAGFVELLKQYPKWRYQSLVLQRVTATYVSLRGRLSDQLREINFCRARLTELRQQFDDPRDKPRTRQDARPGREFFPAGCRDMQESVDQFFEQCDDADWHQFDAAMQDLIHREFGGLLRICLASTNSLPRLETEMLAVAEKFTNTLLATEDVAEMFLAHHPETEAAHEQIAAAFDEAAPDFATARLSRQPEICILVTPSSAAGTRFSELAHTALPDVAPVSASGGDDVVFYREVPNLLLANLDQLGPPGHEAYQQLIAAAHFTPHCRVDIGEWQALCAVG